MKPWEHISGRQYQRDFGIAEPRQNSNISNASDEPSKPRARQALEHALEIRKFEIDLYWKRANYFWTFIAVAFAGYAAVQSGQHPDESSAQLSLLIAALGLVFSWAWFCANSASKRWQENWENHVDLLENGVNGPLYKTIIEGPKVTRLSAKAKHFIWDPKNLSVSQINQVISLFVFSIWMLLIINLLWPLSPKLSIDWFRVWVLGLSGLACILICCSTTDRQDKEVYVWRRHSSVKDPDKAVG